MIIIPFDALLAATAKRFDERTLAGLNQPGSFSLAGQTHPKDQASSQAPGDASHF